MSLVPLFRPRSIAVVGASANSDKAGHIMLRSLSCFGGSLYPVNPRESEILGRRTWSRIDAIPGPIDLAVLTVPATAVAAALEQCAAASVAAAMICSGGFAEIGAEGQRLQRDVADIARSAGIRVLGPNTSGFLSPATRTYASFVPGVDRIRPGPISLVAQSGGVNHALAFAAENEGWGVRLAVGLGNAMDVESSDVIEYLAVDGETRVIALHLEGIRDYRRLYESVRAVSATTPVVALKAGRSDVSAFARSHTGRLMGDWRLGRAAIVQAGGVVVDTTAELLDAARALAGRRMAPCGDPGVAIISGQAGPALLMADLLRTRGVTLPPLEDATRERLREHLPPLTFTENPVDTGRPGPSFGSVVDTVLADPGIGAAVVHALHEPAAVDLERVARLSFVRCRSPLIVATGGAACDVSPVRGAFEDAGIPAYANPERAAHALWALVADARARFRRGTERRARRGTIAPELRPGQSFDEHDAKSLLAELGIPRPAYRICANPEEVRRAVTALRAPVAVKALGKGLLHKTEAGAVQLDVAGPEHAERALQRLEPLRAAGAARYLVEEMAGDGVDLIVGVRRRPDCGPCVMVGLGGTAVEALDDVAVRLCPVSTGDVLEMLAELRAQRLLDGFRGGPVVDRAALASTVVTLADLLVEADALSLVEINPLRVTTAGTFALDAVVASSPESSPGRARARTHGHDTEPSSEPADLVTGDSR